MKGTTINRCFNVCIFFVSLTLTPSVWAQYWVSFDQDTRYMALGDSLTAGYGAHPATGGFVYRLYQGDAIDNINHMLFCNAGVPGATSEDVLKYQVPQVKLFFKETGQQYRKIITLTVGGNDMLQIMDGKDPALVLTTLGGNLAGILGSLVSQIPDVRIYVANIHDPRLPVTNEPLLVAAVNQLIADVVQMFPQNAVLADVFSAFDGRSGLLLMEKKDSGMQIHPSDAGYRVMAEVFADAMRDK